MQSQFPPQQGQWSYSAPPSQPQQQWPPSPQQQSAYRAPQGLPPQPPAPAPKPPARRKLTPVKIASIVIALVVLGVIAGVGYKVFAPKSGTANDTNPFANTTPGTSSTPGTGKTPGAGNTPGATPSGAVVLATGKFIDTGSGDHGSGNVTIGRTADGKYLIHLDNLNVVAGPDLHVYLAKPANPSGSDQVTNGGVDLGSLSANQGSVNVPVPDAVGASLQTYKSVVIYCKSFSVIFTVAPLQFNNY